MIEYGMILFVRKTEWCSKLLFATNKSADEKMHSPQIISIANELSMQQQQFFFLATATQLSVIDNYDTALHYLIVDRVCSSAQL